MIDNLVQEWIFDLLGASNTIITDYTIHDYKYLTWIDLFGENITMIMDKPIHDYENSARFDPLGENIPILLKLIPDSEGSTRLAW